MFFLGEKRLPTETSSCDLSSLSVTAPWWRQNVMSEQNTCRPLLIPGTVGLGEQGTHINIATQTHTHSYTTGHLLSLSGLVSVDEYKKDEHLIRGSPGVHYRTAHVRDYFLWLQLKTQIEHGFLSWIWLPAVCLPLTRQLSGAWLWPLDVETTATLTLCWPLFKISIIMLPKVLWTFWI